DRLDEHGKTKRGRAFAAWSPDGDELWQRRPPAEWEPHLGCLSKPAPKIEIGTPRRICSQRMRGLLRRSTARFTGGKESASGSSQQCRRYPTCTSPRSSGT